jgi:signal transduction histidine kinase
VSLDITTKDGGVLVRVRDDGVGFASNGQTQEIGHLGVTSMRERAEICGGTYSISSMPGDGTTVEFWIPESLDKPGVLV